MKWKRCNRPTICLLGSMLLVASCTLSSRSRPPLSQPAPAEREQQAKADPGKKEAAAADQIIFITMTMAQDPKTGNREIRVQDLLKTAGTLKPRPRKPLPSGPYLSCIFYSGPERLDSLHLEHPLFRQVEYVNAQHQLAQKAVKADQAEFFIRFRQGQADLLKIEEKMSSSTPKELITIKF